MFADLAITPLQALVFGLLTLPITLWIVWTDMTEMVIRNKAVLAMLAIFAVGGLFLLPLAEYGWRWSHFAVVLVVGYLMSAAFGFGAGDMKYAASVAPFIPLGDVRAVCFLFVIWSVVLLALFLTARASSGVRAAAANWSWVNATMGGDSAIGRLWKGRKLKTPFGLALAPTISSYFFLGAIA